MPFLSAVCRRRWYRRGYDATRAGEPRQFCAQRRSCVYAAFHIRSISTGLQNCTFSDDLSSIDTNMQPPCQFVITVGWKWTSMLAGQRLLRAVLTWEHRASTLSVCLSLSAVIVIIVVLVSTKRLLISLSLPVYVHVYTLCLKKVPTFKLSVTLSNLNRFSTFCATGKRMKFATKLIQHYPPHLSVYCCCYNCIKQLSVNGFWSVARSGQLQLQLTPLLRRILHITHCVASPCIEAA